MHWQILAACLVFGCVWYLSMYEAHTELMHGLHLERRYRPATALVGQNNGRGIVLSEKADVESFLELVGVLKTISYLRFLRSIFPPSVTSRWVSQ